MGLSREAWSDQEMKIQREDLNKTTAQAFAYMNSCGSSCWSNCKLCLKC